MVIHAGNNGVNLVGEAGSAMVQDTPLPPPAKVTVHIVGEVLNPGVVVVPEGSRVADVLAMAGGATNEANPYVNLARIVRDGEQIIIPKIGEEIPMPESVEADLGSGGLVNINSADIATLQTLPGIGPATAQNIVNFRNVHGPFERIEDLMRVNRIGESIFNGLMDSITVG
jgi:competence protein ComEA